MDGRSQIVLGPSAFSRGDRDCLDATSHKGQSSAGHGKDPVPRSLQDSEWRDSGRRCVLCCLRSCTLTMQQ